MGLGQTQQGTQVGHNGITWTFSDTVTWGNFVNGDPWIVVPDGQSVNLIGIEPAPRFIPVNQILVTVGGSPTTADTLVGITSGITASLFGITLNPSNQEYGLYINGSILNPLRYGDTMLKFAGASFTQSIDFPRTASFGAIYQHGIDSRFTYTNTSNFNIPMQLGNVAGGRMRFSATEANGWLNLASQPRQLVSGDMLVSFECPFYENSSNFNHAALPSNTPGSPTTDRSDMTKIRFVRQAILTAVPRVPDENEFRPPLYWSSTRVNETDLGSSAGQRPSLMGRFIFTPEAEQKLNDNAFIDLPTKDIFDRDISPRPNSIAVYNESDMDTLISPNYSPAISWGFGPIDKSISSPLANMWNAPNIDSLIASNGPQNLFARAFRQEALIGSKAIGAFCSYISPTVRKKCIIQAIQYGIDMYGATTTGARNMSGAARPAIILAGWFLNDYPMMLIDKFDVPQLSNMFSVIRQRFSSEYSTMTKNEFLCLQKFMNGSAERLASTIRFVECGEFTRIKGKITDIPVGVPNLIFADEVGQKYTDPMSTDDKGYGAMFKNNGVSGDFGLRIAIAGTTNSSIGVHSSTFMGGNRLHTSDHAFVGITAVVGANQLQLTFPKTATKTIPSTYGINVGNAYNVMTFGGAGTNSNPSNMVWKNMKAKVISGPGASDEVYRVVNTNRIFFIGNTSWSGLTLSEFYFDKPWANGIPDSTSRIIFYPFDDDDVGKVVMNMNSLSYSTSTSSLSNISFYNTARGPSSEDEGMESLETPSAVNPYAFTTNFPDMHTEMRFMNILKWYGLLYALGKRNPSSGLMQNETTQDICDGVIHNLFGNDPFNFHMVSSNSSSSGSDVDITTNFTIHAQPRIRDVGSGLPGFGGILRQIWGRTLPR